MSISGRPTKAKLNARRREEDQEKVDTIRTKLRNARRKRTPKVPSTPRTPKITRKAEDYPTTGEFFNVAYYHQIYDGRCDKCGRTLRVLSDQDNGSPEYECDIVIQCICGNGVDFLIPVN